MKRLTALLILITALMGMAATPGYAGEKYDRIPEALAVHLSSRFRIQGNMDSSVRLEYIHTTNDSINAEIADLVDAYDTALSGTLQKDKEHNPYHNSRLDVECVYAITGERMISIMVQARVKFMAQLVSLSLTTRAYDVITGEKVTLADLLLPDEAVWQMIADEARAQLTEYFPEETPNESTLNALLTREALSGTDYMFGPTALTLCYKADMLYPDKPTAMWVRIPYRALQPYLNEYGAAQLDNSRYKMLALTFDDGPSGYASGEVLRALREHGGRGTFFLVGQAIRRHAFNVMYEHDQLHAQGSHSYTHPDLNELTTEQILNSERLTANALLSVTGLAPHLVRAPGGRWPRLVNAGVKMPILQWTLDTNDWRGGDAMKIAAHINNTAQDGFIVLMHDCYENTADAIFPMCDFLIEKGFMLVTVDDLIERLGVDFPDGTVIYRCTEDGTITNEW